MTGKKYEKEDCIRLLKEKREDLLAHGVTRYPERADFSDREVVAIKAFFGPWPRALEAAGIKPPRADDRLARNREKRARAKRARREADRAEKAVPPPAETEEETILRAAADCGFYQAGILGTENIVFDPAFRPYCEENRCGQYGINYSCPPDCGTPEQMKERVLAYPRALVLSTAWEIRDLSDADRIREVRAAHNAAMFRLIDLLRAAGHDDILMIGASGCMLCHPCKLLFGEPCAYPDRRYSCLSAYCIYVRKLAEDCGMTYNYKDGILPFFGVCCFF